MLNFLCRRKSEIVTPSSAVAPSVEVAQVKVEDDEKARKEWRRQATAVVNNAKFNRSLSKFLAPVKVTKYLISRRSTSNFKVPML
jgi:hypothetical protein